MHFIRLIFADLINFAFHSSFIQFDLFYTLPYKACLSVYFPPLPIVTLPCLVLTIYLSQCLANYSNSRRTQLSKVFSRHTNSNVLELQPNSNSE